MSIAMDIDDGRLGLFLVTIGALFLGMSWSNIHSPSTPMVDNFLFIVIGGGACLMGVGVAQGKLLFGLLAAILTIIAGWYNSGFPIP